MSAADGGFYQLLTHLDRADPRALKDIRRLARLWPPGAPPPSRWTLRWNQNALAILRAWAGLDVVRPGSGLVRLDLDGLADKFGSTGALRSGLEKFLSARGKNPPPSQSIPAGPWPEDVRRWLESRATTGGRVDPALLAAVARALVCLQDPARPGGPLHVSDLGARVGATSKCFRPGSPGRRLLGSALLFLRGNPDHSEETREAALDQAGLVGSYTAYTVLTAGMLWLDDQDYVARLAEKNQATCLTLQNLVSPRPAPGVEGVLTVENEAPFLSLLEEGFHRRWVLALTGGYPNRAVVSLLKSLVPQAGSWRHWGDTDLAGVRIARLLAERLNHAPQFFRCGPDDVRRWHSRLIPLTPLERRAMARDLRQWPQALGADILRANLAAGGWLEQEAWEQ